MPRLRLVVSDVDGTLVTSRKTLLPSTVKAANKLADAGVVLALASSRPPRGLRSLADALAVPGPLAGFNGGFVVDAAGATLARHDLDPADAQTVATLLVGRGVDVWTFQGDLWRVPNRHGPHVDREITTLGYEPVVEQPPSWSQIGKIVGVSDDLPAAARANDIVQQELGGRVAASQSQPYYVDVTHPRANKGDLLGFLAQTYDLPNEAIGSIGDGGNDVVMFQHSGRSVAMGNAAPRVRQHATAVTSSNDEDGWAEAVDLLLGFAEPGTT